MIKTVDRTPHVLSRESRDYQVISHLFDLAFNANKTYVDSMLNNVGTNLVDARFIDLACKTIGFFNKRAYSTNELINIINGFKSIIINKGRKTGIEDAIKLFLNAQRIPETYYIEDSNWIDNENKVLTIYLPASVKDVSLLEELFDYILPAGWLYSFISKDVRQTPTMTTSVVSEHSVRLKSGIQDRTLSTLDYLDEDEPKDFVDLGHVPHDDIDLVTPVVMEDSVISTKTQMDEGK